MADFKFEIVENLGSIPCGGSMSLEINLVKWGNRQAVLDMRKWNEDHTTMGKGFTLRKEDLPLLRNMLIQICEEEDEEN